MSENTSLLTVAQVAGLLGVSTASVYAMVEAGRLACHRIGLGRGTIRISEADLEDFLDACRCGPPAPRPRRLARGPLKHLRL